MLSAPTRSNTVAVVVTFLPDESNSLFAATREITGRLIVIDNSEDAKTTDMLGSAANELDFELITNTKNIGVAAALNQGAQLALEKRAEWLLALDQDSQPLPAILEILDRAFEAAQCDERIGVIGSTSAVDVSKNAARKFREVISVITAGSLINLKAWTASGGFREDFFIDGVDEEYSLRLRRHGYRVIQATEIGIHHLVGEPSRHRLFGREMMVTNHSPSRRYYMTRNRIRLAIEYFCAQPKWISDYFLYSVKDLIRSLLFERQRLKKFCAVLLGIRDALFGRMGPLRNRWLADR